MTIPREAIEPLLQTIGDRLCDMFEQMDRGNWRDDQGHMVRDNKQMHDLTTVLTDMMVFRDVHLNYSKIDPAVLERRLALLNAEHANKHYRHVKSGDIYTIVAFQYREEDMTLHFTYHPDGQPFLKFSRPLSELNRFEVTQ